MSTQTLHPSLPVLEIVELVRSGVREVTGIEDLDDLRHIQACCEAAGVPVTWSISRHGTVHELVEVFK